MIYYHEFPVENGKTIQRGACYKRPEEDRQLRVARYLSGRIDRITTKEDEQLIKWCWEAAFSSGFDGVILSDLSGCAAIMTSCGVFFPVLNEDEPDAGTLRQRNAILSGKGQ